jgi:hypothetical protein
MSKYNIFHPEHDGLASDRLIENAEAMLDILKATLALLTDPNAEPADADALTEKVEAVINHIETGA